MLQEAQGRVQHNELQAGADEGGSAGGQAGLPRAT